MNACRQAQWLGATESSRLRQPTHNSCVRGSTMASGQGAVPAATHWRQGSGARACPVLRCRRAPARGGAAAAAGHASVLLCHGFHHGREVCRAAGMHSTEDAQGSMRTRWPCLPLREAAAHVPGAHIRIPPPKGVGQLPPFPASWLPVAHPSGEPHWHGPSLAPAHLNRSSQQHEPAGGQRGRRVEGGGGGGGGGVNDLPT